MGVEIDLTSATDNEFKPTLFDVHNVLEEEVVGEYESRMSLFTNWILAGRDVMMAGPRASGKTYVTDHVMDFVGNIEKDKDKGQGYIISAGSDKAIWYMMDDLSKAKFVVVLELQKLPKEAQEVLKDWGEGKTSTYKTTQMVGGSRIVKKYELPRRPFVFCLADEDETKVDTQLASRLTVIRTDNSIKQNKDVMMHQAILSKLPENPMKVDEAMKAKLYHHIQTLPLLEKYLFKNPAAEMFVESIPPFFTDCRRDFPKYLANVSGICRFHWKERIRATLANGKDTYFVTPQDMFLNHVIYGRALISSSLKCNNVEREMMNLIQSSSTPLKRADIQKEMKKRGMTLSAGMVSRHLNGLVDLGYLERDACADNKKVLEYTLGQMFQDFMFEIDWKTVVKISSSMMYDLYPEIAEQYHQLYCETPLVKHPFTGEEINLNELEMEQVKTHLGQDKLQMDEDDEKNQAEEEFVGFEEDND